jgi:hypothetical protein
MGEDLKAAAGGRTVLLVGELGFNPDRVLALRRAGHRLYGLWIREPQAWETVGSLPFPGVESLPTDASWRDRVREVRPDLIYGLLNWQALPLLGEVVDADLGIPLVLHFKESPQMAMEMGLWPTLVRVMQHAAGMVFINEECRSWFDAVLHHPVDPQRSLLLDGDLPSARWASGSWAPKLSAADGQIHTVCVGRVRVESRDMVESIPDLSKVGVHVHLYGESYQRWSSDWVAAGQDSGYLHLHPTVEPQRWVAELSRYDAAWPHVHRSRNGGDVLRAHWDDLNLPARLGTYGVAGLPLICRRNEGHVVAVRNLAQATGAAVLYDDIEELAATLSDQEGMARRTSAGRAAATSFTFDNHVDDLVRFFEKVSKW